jgi:hypothetical protein
MIKTQIFTVQGNTDVVDDVIFCRRLEFIGPQAQLVIKPKQGAPLGAPRMLKIITDVISMTLGGGVGEITYNLDGDYFPAYQLPLGNSGLDPETSAKNGDDGQPNFNQGPIPPADVASPNFFDPIDPLNTTAGAFPKARDGGNGAAGGRGGKGVNGAHAPMVEIWLKQIDGDLTIDLRGQTGGKGGKGGNGQFGGQGEDGSNAVPGTEESWIGVPNPVCIQQAGLPGDGGKGGNAGCGGDGGDGGNGGTVKIFNTSGVNLAKIHPHLQKGVGGPVGDSGNPGKGGPAGDSGLQIPPCKPALSSQNGADGSRCISEGRKSVSQPGADGVDGQYFTRTVSNIPQLPGLWP